MQIMLTFYQSYWQETCINPKLVTSTQPLENLVNVTLTWEICFSHHACYIALQRKSQEISVAYTSKTSGSSDRNKAYV